MSQSVTHTVRLDNRVQPGDDTIAQIQVGSPQSKPVTKVTDPVTGKLIEVILETPAAESATASAAIDANAGVATTTAALPPALPSTDITDWTSVDILVSPNVPLGGIQLFSVFAVAPFETTLSNIQALGRLSGDGATNSYNKITVNTNPALRTWTVISLDHHTTTGINIATGELVLTIDGVARSLLLTNNIVLDALTANDSGNTHVKWFYIDVDNKLYQAQEQKVDPSGTIITDTPFLSFPAAVAAQPAGQ